MQLSPQALPTTQYLQQARAPQGPKTLARTWAGRGHQNSGGRRSTRNRRTFPGVGPGPSLDAASGAESHSKGPGPAGLASALETGGSEQRAIATLSEGAAKGSAHAAPVAAEPAPEAGAASNTSAPSAKRTWLSVATVEFPLEGECIVAERAGPDNLRAEGPGPDARGWVEALSRRLGVARAQNWTRPESERV